LADTIGAGFSGFWSVSFRGNNFRPSFIGHELEFIHAGFQLGLDTGSLLVDDGHDGQAAEHGGYADGDSGRSH
jgi:hypothetical protein